MKEKSRIELILDLLKIVFSWPCVVLLIVLLFINPIKSMLDRLTEINTTLFEIKAINPVTIGDVRPEQSPQEAIVELERPQQLEGIAEIFVGTETIDRSSGFVVTEGGFLISDTNVVGNSETVLVRLSGEEELRTAKVVARDSGNFLALLQLPEGRYPALELTRTVSLDQTVSRASARSGFSTGTVQSIQERISIGVDGGQKDLEDVIITSAISEPGDSGSPVVDESRKVVGVVVAGSQTQTVVIPSRQIFKSFPQIAIASSITTAAQIRSEALA